ncbi:MAG: FAD-dependent oxidoreductase [Polyangiales bacterium]
MGTPGRGRRRPRRGWGITGTGVARDAVRRGLGGAVEMNDFAYGTSSRSSKLVHGGLRYLEHGELAMVFESVSERRILMDLAPHLVNPLGFLFPVYKGSRHNLFVINTGMWLYDELSLFRSPKIHRTLSRRTSPSSSRRSTVTASRARRSTTTAPPTTRV